MSSKYWGFSLLGAIQESSRACSGDSNLGTPAVADAGRELARCVREAERTYPVPDNRDIDNRQQELANRKKRAAKVETCMRAADSLYHGGMFSPCAPDFCGLQEADRRARRAQA
jgi:hypothetical protein